MHKLKNRVSLSTLSHVRIKYKLCIGIKLVSCHHSWDKEFLQASFVSPLCAPLIVFGLYLEICC
jgi:hypothetical protein